MNKIKLFPHQPLKQSQCKAIPKILYQMKVTLHAEESMEPIPCAVVCYIPPYDKNDRFITPINAMNIL